MYQPHDAQVKGPFTVPKNVPVRTPPKITPNPKAVVNDKMEVPEIIFDGTRKIGYQRGRFLGKGGFARCYEVVDPNTKQTLACKIVNKGLLQKQHQREKMAQEITIHRDLKHEYIVDFHSYFEDDNNVYIVLELCAKKSLMELQKRRRAITESEARYFLRQLTLAVLYLHEDKKIIHRDLKLGNIFINDNMELKIGDFGLATHISFDGERKKTLCGTPNYIAPEVLAKRGHSFEVDIWSMGCILYTLLFGKPPFETNSLRDTYTKIRRGDYYIPASRIGNSTRNLITRMLQVEPSLRPTAKQILAHEFLTQNFIPNSLPVSCLTTAPRFDRTTRPAAPASSNTKRPLVEHNPRGSPIANRPKTTGKGGNMNTSMEQGYEMSSQDIMELIQTMKNQIVEALTGKGVRKPPTLIDDESEEPSLSPMLWISKWVDYSDKYGFGYQLSDDSIGVSFNDQTKLILLPDLNSMHYIERGGKENYYTTEVFPTELQKKVKLLNYFQQYMKENLLKSTGGKAPPNSNLIPRLPNLWTWFRTSRAVVMILSNGTMQINNFRDHTKMILCPLLGAVSTIGPTRVMRTFKLSLLKEHGYSEDLGARLKYAQEKCEIVLGSPQTVVSKQSNSPRTPRR
ncbi:Serine/threonine-protein kinase PLK1 [Orchesella cincta]|uniref:Serine/threonine-protein kinase PLK n=1 Tax=Orchesella cincta TaxID=48709 RepID=A0A1D2MF42_ORCCI|nr:Serine/threonine-protein kinase PLK1 [Orchesella cincta]